MSLRLRLALWYGALAGSLVLLVCAYSYAVHGRAHYDEADVVLATSAEHVIHEIAETRTDEQRAAVLRASALLDAAMRIHGADGQVRLESAGSAGAPALPLTEALRETPPPYPVLSRLAPPLHRSTDHDGTFGVVGNVNRWRWYARAIPGSTEYLIALVPLARIDGSVAQFGILMLFMAAIGLVTTYLAAWVVAASALRPVALMTDTARAIARSGEFSRRIAITSLSGRRDELAQLAAVFNEMLSSLAEAYATQQRFVSDASHELRAPLTTIQANLELLRDRNDLSTEARDTAVQEAAMEATRLARLVADLLALARADAGTTLRRQPVELDRVLMEVVGESRHLLQGQRLEVGVLEPATVPGDRDRIKQVLLILVDNAIKYTASGSHVRVSLRRSPDVVTFEVQDDGIGIAAEDLPRVFERFYRADRARSRDPGGTGLGLPIARWIARAHGGDVTLHSASGRGTIAAARFPVDG